MYSAHDVRLRRDVAVRIFDRPVEAGSLVAAAQMWSAGLSRILDAGQVVEDDGSRRDFVAREVVRGLSLGRLTAAIECRPTTIAAMGASVAATLAALHARGAAHGALHPGNIFLRDFAASPDWGRDADDSTVLTDFGVGSACPQRPDPADDVRALGLSLLTVLTARSVTGHRTARSALVRLRRHPGLTVAERATWHDVIGSVTDPDPNRRPSAAALVAELRRLRTGHVR